MMSSRFSTGSEDLAMPLAYHHPLMDLPSPYYRAIGEYIFRYAQLEYQLHEIIWAAMDLGPKEGRSLTIGTDIRVLVGICSTIVASRFWIKEPEALAAIKAFASATQKASSFRNELAHGSWQSRERRGPPRLHRMKESGNRIMPDYDATLDAKLIRSRAKALRTWNLRARRLIDFLEDARPPTSRHKHAERSLKRRQTAGTISR
jgi:hypothetical protein